MFEVLELEYWMEGRLVSVTDGLCVVLAFAADGTVAAVVAVVNGADRVFLTFENSEETRA